MAEQSQARAFGARFEDVARRLPHKTALVEDGRAIDYATLESRSRAIAARIEAAAAGRPGFVALLFPRKTPMVESMVGALRCGRAYVPLDTGDPDERLRFVLRDAAPVALLVERGLAARARSLAGESCTVVEMDGGDVPDPVYPGKKSDAERFAGAHATYTIEALMKDGKALQAGTSHHLGQHFAKVFDITYQDEQGKRQFCWQTSWGVSTRLVGALVMTHGDDQGLRLPPNVAPIQAVIVPIWRKDADRSAVLEFIDKVKAAVGKDVRLHVDDRDQYSPGWKYNEYEMRGVPVRLEIGPKDVANAAVMSVRRDTRGKESIPLASLAERLPALLDEIQRSLFEQAKAFREQNTVLATSKDEVIAHFSADKRGFVAMPWDGSAEVEGEIKERCGATLRCMPMDPSPFASLERPGHRVALFARAY